MKSIINPNYFILILLLFISTRGQSQTDTVEAARPASALSYPPLEVGLLLGGANAYGDLVDTRFFKPSNTNLAYGLFVRYHIDRNFSIRGSINRGKLSGSDLDSETLASRGISFEASLTEASLVGEFDFLGHTRFVDNGLFKGKVAPYVFAGFAFAAAQTDTDFSSLSDLPNLQELAQIDRRNQKDAHISLPFGLGAKIDLNSQWVLGLEVGLRPVFNDYLDGVSAAGNPNRNDWYSVGGLTLSYRVGGKDSDKDGFLDRNDPCPNLAGAKGSLGCPDSDGDGLFDNEDRCPNEAGPEETAGCPDSDGDGVPDIDDECPNVPGSIKAKGCPDRDGDGVVDAEDRCPDIFGLPELKGCRDSDGDGIADIDDKCPYVKGEAEFDGCPTPSAITSSEKPDEPDNEIIEPEQAQPEPTAPASEENVAMSAVDEALVKSTVNDIKFITGSYKLISTSFAALNQLADLMKRYPDYHIRIEGHTDDRGEAEANKQLSTLRAKACFDYLHKKGGIPEERMSYEGFGQEQPRATNETVSGRRQNRRVEFTMYKP